MDKHREFSAKLKRVLQQLPYSRNPNLPYFVCTGYPLECEAFVVGINPATTTTHFSELFDSQEEGRFDIAAFRMHYAGIRNRGVRPKLERIEQSAAPVQVLQTNLWGVEAASPRDVPAELTQTGIFEFLLQQIRPKALLVHGREAAKAIASVSTLIWEQPPQIGFAADIKTSYGESIWVRVIHHLARRGSYADAERYGMELRAKVEKKRRERLR